MCAEAAVKWGASNFQVYSSLNAKPFYASLGLTRVKEIDLSMTPATFFRTVLMEGPIKV